MRVSTSGHHRQKERPADPTTFLRNAAISLVRVICKPLGCTCTFEVFGDRDGCGPGEVRMGKRKVLMFGSNDYLDLITIPR